MNSGHPCALLDEIQFEVKSVEVAFTGLVHGEVDALDVIAVILHEGSLGSVYLSQLLKIRFPCEGELSVCSLPKDVLQILNLLILCKFLRPSKQRLGLV